MLIGFDSTWYPELMQFAQQRRQVAQCRWSQYRNAVASGMPCDQEPDSYRALCQLLPSRQRDPTLPRYGTDSIDTTAHYLRHIDIDMILNHRKPTKEELLAAVDKTISDVIAPNLRVLFCGINPGLYSGATGHHFARPGNRFWPALHHSGFTDRILSPYEEHELLSIGCGVTNVVRRTTASAAELSVEDFVEGGRRLRTKVRRYRPRVLAVLGITAFRSAFARPKAQLGRQSEMIGETAIWVLPNPSGLNAHYQPKELARLFRELRLKTEALRKG